MHSPSLALFQRVIWFLVLCLALPIQLLGGCDEETVSPLRLGTNVWPGYEPLYLARDLGIMDPQHVRLVQFVSATEVIRGIETGSIEAAALTLDEVLRLHHKRVPMKIVLVTDISNGGDVILGRPGIPNFASLAGKRIAVESTALGAFTLTRALDINNMDESDIEVVSLEVNEQEAAFTKGTVDAVVTFDPVRSRLIDRGAKILFSSKEIPGEIVDVIAVRTDAIQRHRTHLEHLLSSWFRALREMTFKPKKSADLMSARLKLDTDKVLAAFAGLTFPDRMTSEAMVSGNQPQLRNVARRLQDVMVRHKLIESQRDVDELFLSDPSFGTVN